MSVPVDKLRLVLKFWPFFSPSDDFMIIVYLWVSGDCTIKL